MNPQYVSVEEIPAGAVEKERSIRLEQARAVGQAGGGDRQDRRRSDRQVAEGDLSPRAAVGEGRQEDHQRSPATSSSARSARTARSAASRATSSARGWRRRRTTSPPRSPSRRASRKHAERRAEAALQARPPQDLRRGLDGAGGLWHQPPGLDADRRRDRRDGPRDQGRARARRRRRQHLPRRVAVGPGHGSRRRRTTSACWQR